MGERTDEVTGALSQERDIRREIDRTQLEMSRTIDEIQRRLSPSYMMQKTKDSIREAGVRTSRGFMDRVRENPIPAAMVGVGLFFLMRNREENDFETNRINADWERSVLSNSSVAEYRDFDYSGGASRLDNVRDRVSGAASHVRDQASHAVDSAKDATQEVLQSAAERTAYLRELARRRAHAAQNQTRDFFTANPMMAGVAAIAFGALIGSLIPETQKENEMMGATRDRLAERAKDVARDGLDRAKNIASAATTAATDAAKTAAKTNQKTDVGQSIGVGSDINI